MYSKILVPLDGSDLAECSLEHLKAIAQGCKVSKVILLQVVEPLSVESSLRSEFSSDFVENIKKSVKNNAESYLNGIASNLKNMGFAIETVVEDGMAAEVILEHASKENVDLIIMSTHGRSGVVRWALGSVADKVIRHSAAPVFLITPKTIKKS